MISSAPFLWIPIGSRTHCAGFKKWWPPTFWRVKFGIGTGVPLKNPNPLRSQESKPRPQTTHQNRNSWYAALSPCELPDFHFVWLKKDLLWKKTCPHDLNNFLSFGKQLKHLKPNGVQFSAIWSMFELQGASQPLNELLVLLSNGNEQWDFFLFLSTFDFVFNEKCPNLPEEQRYKLWSVHYGGCHAGQRLPMPNHDFTNLESCTRLNQVLEGSGVMLWKNCPGSDFYFKNPTKTGERSWNMETVLFECIFKTFQIFL